MGKKKPEPFGPLYREYADSLQEVVLRAGLLAEHVRTLISLGQIPEQHKAALQARLDDYERAWNGDADMPG